MMMLTVSSALVPSLHYHSSPPLLCRLLPPARKRGRRRQRAASDLQISFHAFLHAGRGRGASRWWGGADDARLLAVLCGFGAREG